MRDKNCLKTYKISRNIVFINKNPVKVKPIRGIKFNLVYKITG